MSCGFFADFSMRDIMLLYNMSRMRLLCPAHLKNARNSEIGHESIGYVIYGKVTYKAMLVSSGHLEAKKTCSDLFLLRITLMPLSL